MRAASDDSPRPLEFVLHIGPGATGAPSIQAFLRHNQKRLADQGVLYPHTPGRTRHTRLGTALRSRAELDSPPRNGPQRVSSDEEPDADLQRRLFREIDQSASSRVILSDETLYGSTNAELRRLHDFVRPNDGVRVIVYLRRQDDHLIHRYQQVVKAGETRRLVDRAQQLNLSRTYDHAARLSAWQQLIEPTDLIVRRFERDSFVAGSLHQDFLDAAGIDLAADELEQAAAPADRLDAETVELLRILNIYRSEDDDAATRLPSQSALVSRLVEVSAGPTLTAPPHVLDQFMKNWAEANSRVAREYLGDESGVLFRAPRETDDTTTEQHFDPARLEHFAALLDLPAPLDKSLRRLVDREAAVQQSGPRRRANPRRGRAVNRESSLATYDDAARSIIERVLPWTMTHPEKISGLISATRYVVANNIPGDIVECGVWRGGSMQAAALTLLDCGDTSRNLHLFDTFDGMTPPEPVDRRRDGRTAAELLASSGRDSRVWAVADLQDVRAGMAAVGYPADRVHYHPGRVEDTIPDEAPDVASILRLDTDWYASTRHELEHLYHRLSPGGVLIIDDYGYWEGSRRATDEFVARSGAPLLLVALADGVIAVKPGLSA